MVHVLDPCLPERDHVNQIRAVSIRESCIMHVASAHKSVGQANLRWLEASKEERISDEAQGQFKLHSWHQRLLSGGTHDSSVDLIANVHLQYPILLTPHTSSLLLSMLLLLL
jgi:hypothetical protein